MTHGGERSRNEWLVNRRSASPRGLENVESITKISSHTSRTLGEEVKGKGVT